MHNGLVNHVGLVLNGELVRVNQILHKNTVGSHDDPPRDKEPWQQDLVYGPTIYDDGINRSSVPTNKIHQGHLTEIEKDYDPALDFTVPGHNYLGPGTNIIKNLREQIQPTDDADLNALYHDVAYATSKNQKDIISADKAFVKNHNFDPESTLAKLALAAKNIIGVGPKAKDYHLDSVDYDMIADYMSMILHRADKG